MAKAKVAKAVNGREFVAAFGAVLWGFVESAAASASRSADAMRIVGDMYANLSPERFTSECAALFGNGERGKANVKGELIDALESRAKAEGKTVPVSARGFVSQVRTVALNFGNADVRKAAAESGTRAAYDVAKPKANDEPKVDDKATAKPLTDAEIVAALLERNGLQTVLGMIESRLSCLADPIRAGVVHDARVKVAA